MKKIDEILESKRVVVLDKWNDGFCGWIYLGGWEGSVVATTGGGWEHVSVCPRKKKVPTWDDMCNLKNIFFYEDETCVQFHPCKKDYVNNLENCLHLWRYTAGVMPTPPRIFVGIPKNATPDEIKKEMSENGVNPALYIKGII